jgi:signal transduction histidine kinase
MEQLKERHLGVLRALTLPTEEAAIGEVLEQVALSVAGTEARFWEVDARGALQLRGIWPSASSDGMTPAPLTSAVPPVVDRAISNRQLTFAETEGGGPAACCLCIPAVGGQQLVGAIDVRGPQLPRFDDSLLLHLNAIGAHLGSYLARCRNEADFARSLEELHRINGERRRLMRLLVAAHEDERRTIAVDIHDDPLQVMAAVALRLHSLHRRLDDEPSQRTVEAVEEMVSSAVSRLRRLMFNLRPPGLDRGDLMGPLSDRLEQVREDELIEFSLAGSEPAALTSEVRVTLYRIAQEAIANVIKHASARHIDVTVDEQDGGCLMRIVDDGAGLGGTLEDRPGHLGLPSMRERAELAGGWLRVEAGDRSGTVVSAWVPMLSEVGQGGGHAP